MDIPAQAYVAIGAVCAALIAGFFSYLNLVISKESKVSEFRQNWIDELRSEIGEFAASTNALALLHRQVAKSMTNKEWLDKSLPVIDKLDKAYTSITLRINGAEGSKEHKEINEKFLSALETVRTAYKDGNFEQARTLLIPLRDSAQPLLKYEWERVKAGEKAYKHGKFIALAVLISGVLGIGYIFHLMPPSIQSVITPQPSPETQQPNKSESAIRNSNSNSGKH
jgi:hypothetical protein